MCVAEREKDCVDNNEQINYYFFARFEAQISTTAQKTPPPPGDQVMMLSPNSVRRSLSRINARKAPGPDNIPGRVLRDCAVELTDVSFSTCR